MKLFIIHLHVRLLKANTQENRLKALLSKILKGKIFSKFLAVVDLDSKLLYKFNLPKSVSDRGSVLRYFMGYNTTSNLVLLKNVYVIIAHSSEESSAAKRSRTGTNDSDGLFV